MLKEPSDAAQQRQFTDVLAIDGAYLSLSHPGHADLFFGLESILRPGEIIFSGPEFFPPGGDAGFWLPNLRLHDGFVFAVDIQNDLRFGGVKKMKKPGVGFSDVQDDLKGLP